MVNERVVRILLECILVENIFIAKIVILISNFNLLVQDHLQRMALSFEPPSQFSHTRKRFSETALVGISGIFVFLQYANELQIDISKIGFNSVSP